MVVSASERLMSGVGVKMTRREVMRLVATLFTSLTDAARTPKRMVPRPGMATE